MLTSCLLDSAIPAAVPLLAAPPIAGGALRVPYAAFNSVVHKLLHAAATVVLGRQHLHYCMAARKATNRLAGSFVLLHPPQVTELQWWLLPLIQTLCNFFQSTAHSTCWTWVWLGEVPN